MSDHVQEPLPILGGVGRDAHGPLASNFVERLDQFGHGARAEFVTGPEEVEDDDAVGPAAICIDNARAPRVGIGIGIAIMIMVIVAGSGRDKGRGWESDEKEGIIYGVVVGQE